MKEKKTTGVPNELLPPPQRVEELSVPTKEGKPSKGGTRSSAVQRKHGKDNRK